METMSEDNNRKPTASSQQASADRIDFGSDADVVLPRDPEFDAWVSGIAPALNAPKAAPRDDMWAAIQAAQQTSRAAQAGRIPGVTPFRKHWRLMSVIAAALLIGVAIDRFALREKPATVASNPAPSPLAPDSTDDASRLYRLAATQTLTQAEALLTAYRASGIAARDTLAGKQLATWGRQVLGSTRLLIDSPAGSDPRLRSLLDDLELVLVQIIQISGAPLDPGERALIERALEERDLLPRIRNAVPAGNIGVGNSASD
jgi:hypothetical protein